MLPDSNIVIYSFRPEYPTLRRFIDETDAAVSAISYVEVLGFHRIGDVERRELEEFFAGSIILPVSSDVLDRAVALRRARRMSLGDALIAATALVHRRTLVTRNVSDFDWIDGLALHDPLPPV